jgi:hypothetical protein
VLLVAGLEGGEPPNLVERRLLGHGTDATT